MRTSNILLLGTLAAACVSSQPAPTCLWRIIVANRSSEEVAIAYKQPGADWRSATALGKVRAQAVDTFDVAASYEPEVEVRRPVEQLAARNIAVSLGDLGCRDDL